MSDSAFLIVCSEKSESNASDQKLESAFQSLSLKRLLGSLTHHVPDSGAAYLPGAGAVFQKNCTHAVVDGRWLSLFAGKVDNYAYLVKKYCLDEAGLDAKSTYLLETVRALSSLSDAQVVVHLYKKLGPTFMSKMKGAFAFVIYDAQVGRILAVCDRLATYPLIQGHLNEGGALVVACGVQEAAQLPMGSVATIGAGEYKFGWRCEPVAYMASSDAVANRCEEARNAAMQALMSASLPVPLSASAAPRSRANSVYMRRTFQSTSKGGASARASFSGGGTTPPPRHSLHTCAPVANLSPTDARPRERPAPWGRPSIGAASSGTAPLARPEEAMSRKGSYVPPHRRSSIAMRPVEPPALPAVAEAHGHVPPSNGLAGRSSGAWRRGTMDAGGVGAPAGSTGALPPGSALNRPSAPSVPDAAVAAMSSFYQAAPVRSTQNATSASASSDNSPAEARSIERFSSDSGKSEESGTISFGARSQPIPITPSNRTSHESRSSLALLRGTDDDSDNGAAAESADARLGNLAPLKEDKTLHSSTESVLGSMADDESVPDKAADKPSSLVFEWSDAGSGPKSASASDMLASRRPPKQPSARASDLPPHSPPLQYALGESPSSSQKTAHARKLLSQVARTLSASGKMASTDLPDAPLGKAPGAGAPADSAMDTSVFTGDGLAADVDVDADGEITPAPPPATETKLHSTGSFPDVLALLMHGREPSTSLPSPSASRASNEIGGVESAATVGTPAVLHTLKEDASGSIVDDGANPAPNNLPSALLEELAGSDCDPQVQAMLASLLYSSPCALCIVDAQADDQPVVYVNDMFEMKTGYSAADVVGRNCRFLQAPPDMAPRPSPASAALKKAVQEGRSQTCKMLNYRKDGSPLWNSLSIVPVRATSGSVTHFVGMQTFTQAPHTHARNSSLAGASWAGMRRPESSECLAPHAALQALPFSRRSSSYQVLALDGDVGAVHMTASG